MRLSTPNLKFRFPLTAAQVTDWMGITDQHNKLENPEQYIHKNATEDKIGSRV